MRTFILIWALATSAHAQTSWDNNPFNWKNSELNIQNSPLAWDNNPLNWNNSALNINSNRGIYDNQGTDWGMKLRINTECKTFTIVMATDVDINQNNER
jgi:hypothetical protein